MWFLTNHCSIKKWASCQRATVGFCKILDFFSEKSDEFIGVDKSAQISSSSKIGTNVNIGPNVVIGEKVTIDDNATIGANSVIGAQSRIGNNSKIYCNVHLYQNSLIGSDCIIHSGVVIGADGFGFISSKDDHFKIPQLGKVVIGNNVKLVQIPPSIVERLEILQ